MGFVVKNIKAIQQPVQLLAREAQYVFRFGPAEALLLKTLVPNDKPVALPAQQFHLIATTITEHKQRVHAG